MEFTNALSPYCDIPIHLTHFEGIGRFEPRWGGNVWGRLVMRDWFLLTTIMVLGFGFTLGKLAFDEWRIKRSQRNHGAGS
jgi:hypothetical protein